MFKEIFTESKPTKQEMLKYLEKFKSKKYKGYSWTDIRDSVAAKYNLTASKDMDYISDQIGEEIYNYCQNGKNCKGTFTESEFEELFQESKELTWLEFISDDRTYDLRAGMAQMYANDMRGFEKHLKREYSNYLIDPKKYMKGK